MGPPKAEVTGLNPVGCAIKANIFKYLLQRNDNVIGRLEFGHHPVTTTPNSELGTVVAPTVRKTCLLL
jgi:hypothetical protein